MAFMYGQSRIFFVMARDGLLPQRLSKVHPRFGTPVLMTFITSVIVGADRGVRAAAEHRGSRQRGDADRVHRRRGVHGRDPTHSPAASTHVRSRRPTWIIGVVAVLGCLYLFDSLQTRRSTTS
jgi:APA family basic amino acid/polyamine antiporter